MKPLKILIVVFVAAAVGLAFKGPVSQPIAYHDYGDQRTLLGIPYFWNVVSNLPMFFIGLYGLVQAFRNWSVRPEGVARLIPVVMSAGVFITCFGSAWYHAAPTNETLMWDRLPMTLMFMSLFALLVYDFLGRQEGTVAFWIAVPLGMLSVLYWHFTEAAGHGDLRPYALVQYFPLVAAPVLIFMSPTKVFYGRYLLIIIGLYALAKLFEHNDKLVYHHLGFWSGHTLKHLVGAIGLVYAVKLLDKWRC
jgi:Ceramidase